jgi:hypothetical protein
MLTTCGPALLLALALLLAPGCSKEEAVAAVPASNVPESFFVATPPPAARSVREVVASATDGELVVVSGRVGGAEKVFVDDYAVFTIVDASLPPCGAGRMDDCATPWDYCCDAPELVAANALSVELVADGKLLKAQPRGFHGLDVLKTVVVQGTVSRDAAGNTRVLATGLHVVP